jgi:hypothetical protein
MPADDGVWVNDDQSLCPPRPELRQKDPERTIHWGDPRLGPFLGVGGKLLTQGEFDGRLLIPASQERWDAGKDERHEVEQWSHRGGDSARDHCSPRN